MDSLQSRSLNPVLTLTIDASGESNLDRKSLREILIELIAELDARNGKSSSISTGAYCIDNLRLRDLRRLDPNAGFAEETSIISRKHAVLFTMVLITFRFSHFSSLCS